MQSINVEGMSLDALEDQLRGVQEEIKARCETLAQPAREPQAERQLLEALQNLLERRREVLMSLGLAYARSRHLVSPDETARADQAAPIPHAQREPPAQVIPQRLAPARPIPDDAPTPGARILSRPDPSSPTTIQRAPAARVVAPIERTPTQFRDEFDAEVWDALIRLLRAADPPTRDALQTLVGQVAERHALEHMLDSALGRLHLLSDENQVRFLELVQARVRAYQHHSGASHDEIHTLHHRMRDYLEDRRPGMAHGFALHHEPRRGDWLADAEALRAVLLEDLQRHPELLPEPDRPPAARPPARATSAAEDEEAASALPDDWPWWPLTRGKRALILGGARRPHTCRQYEETFGFAEVEWWEEDASTYSRVLQRVEGGTLDFIIITRFAGHDELYTLKEPCKAHGVPRARLPQGYGAGALRAWIEENLTAPA